MNSKIALLPLYLRLYDDSFTECRHTCEEAAGTAGTLLAAQGVDVVRLPVCRVAEEFSAAIRHAESEEVDALALLHLAYSPSLEADAALVETDLPLIVMSATPDFDFGPETADGSTLMRNHGIHGAQDLCNILLRRGKDCAIEAGHLGLSDVAARTAHWCRAAAMRRVIRSLKVGLIGSPFPSMGDFQVNDTTLHTGVGPVACHTTVREVANLMAGVSEGDIDADVRKLSEAFELPTIDTDVLRMSVKAGITVRRWMKREGLGAFAMSFTESTKENGMPAPFVFACEAMAEGIGYAGEGDILTASLTAAILSAFPDATFTEMFCPDWKGGRIFLSHMAEINPLAAAEKPRIIPVSRTYLELPTCAVAARCKPGTAVIVNLAPLAEGKFRLILVPVTVEDVDGPGFQDSIRAWAKPAMPLERMLEEYCRLGGTHHSVMAYGKDAAEVLRRFGSLMKWDVKELA